MGEPASKTKKLSLKRKLLRHFAEVLRSEHQLERNMPLPEEVWQPQFFQVNDRDIKCVYREASNPKGLIALSSGLRAPTAAYKSMIEELNKNGLSVLIMELPQPEDYDGDPKGFYNHFKDIIKAFYTAEDSPLLKIIERRAQNLPIFNMTHSTSGLVYADLMVNDAAFREAQVKAMRPYVSISPFFSASNMSKFANDWLESPLKWLFQRNADELPADTIIGNLNALRLYLLKNGSLRDLKSAPRFGDILELIKNGERVVDQLREKIKITHLPQTFLLSHNDPHACHKTAEIAAKRLGASASKTAGEHNPLDGDPELMAQLIEALNDLHEERETLIKEVKIQIEAAEEIIREGETNNEELNLPVVREIVAFFQQMNPQRALASELHPDLLSGQDDNPLSLKGHDKERLLRTVKSIVGDYAANPLLQNGGQPIDAPLNTSDDSLYAQDPVDDCPDRGAEKPRPEATVVVSVAGTPIAAP